MTARMYALQDTATMLRRNLRRVTRYPVAPAIIVGIPVVILLLFVYVFGDTMGAGLGGSAADRAGYANYVTPGIILIAIAGSTQGTAISVAMDMSEGIMARFRTMAIARLSVLNGHVVSNLIQIMLGLAVVVGVALLVGFRPTAGPIEWLSAVGLLTLVALALTWLSVAFGLVAKTVEGASNLPMPLILLPFLGSGFVPTEGMPAGLRWFAEYQPFTPIMDTLRGLLLGTPIGTSGAIAVAWCLGMLLAGYAWARKLYDRDPVA
jgi:ABC-2 type transport system permease protein